MAGPSDWGAVAVADAAPSEGPAAWGAEPVAAAPAPVTAGGGRNILPLAAQVAPHVERVMEAFGHGFREGFGPDKLGLSDESAKWLSEKKIFGPAQGGYDNPLQAANELLFDTMASTADAVARGASGAFRGAQAAVFTGLGEGTFGRTIASIPEAFMGSPHPLGIPKGFPAIEGIHVGQGAEPIKFAGEPLPSAGVAPANMGADGVIYVGKSNTMHFLVSEKNAEEIRSKLNLQPGEPTWQSEGFVTPDGQYLDRKQAFDWVQKNEKKVKSSDNMEPNELDALDYYEQVPETRRATLDKLIEAQAKESAKPPLIDQARELGVIGPEKPPVTLGTPAEAAEREVPRASAAARTGDDVLRGPKETANGEPIDAWQARFEKWVDRVKVPDDVKEMIKDSAAENNNFPEARRGDIPLSHVEALADSAGIDPATISQTQRSAMGRLMRTDDEIRVAKQLFDQAAENFRTARDAAEADRTPENLIKVQEAIMRRDMALEQVIGLRAEWGRSGNALKDLLESVKSEQGLTDFLKDKGSSLDELNTIIDGTKGLDRTQTARVLSAMRDRKMGPVYWTWVQGLIAGIITHTKYVFANATYAELERGVTTPVAALIGVAKKFGGVEAERVFFGDVVAEHVGMIGAVPNAFMTAARSIKNGIRAPLDAETTLRQAMIDRGERVPISLERAAGMIPQERPISGVWGRIIGAPGDVAGGIHTFFKVLGLEAGKTTEAYRAAIKEGIDPRDDQFFERMNHHYLNPTEAALQRSVDDAYKGTFMQELGPRGKAFQRFIRDIPGLRWTFPFSHIPVNLVKAGYEYTPFAVLDGEMRAAIKGDKGGVAQDKAIARMVVGSAVMGWFTNLYLNGKATGDYPLDPKERDEWKLRRTMPNSILINGEWVSFERFGPVGTLMRNGANVGSVIQHLRAEDDDAMSKATVYAANAAARTIIDEVGFTMLNNLFEAYHDEKKGRALISSTAATLIPFSSLWRQTASAMDPDMRKAETLIDGIKMSIPGRGIPGVIGGRETLTPKRDWTGTPIHNPGFGGDLPLPGASAILRHAAVNMDPVDREMDTLHIHPAPPQARIGGVALPSKLYDEYQSTAGPMTRVALEHMVNAPGWGEMPPFVREQAFRATIEAMRKAAGAIMQARHPEIIQQGIDNRVNHINGEKKTKLKD